jgi:hypothetical protein
VKKFAYCESSSLLYSLNIFRAINLKGNGMGREFRTRRRCEKFMQNFSWKKKGREHLEEAGVDGTLDLMSIIVWTGLNRFRIGTSCGLV